MSIIDLLKLSTRMFKARTSRTFLTILGMGVGIGAILFLVALGFGIQKTLLETITTADSLVTLDVYPGEKMPAISIADIENIKNIAGVEMVSPALETMGQLTYASLVSDSKVKVVDANFLRLDGIKVTGGDSISDANMQGVVISTALAKVFEKTPTEMLGENMQIAILKNKFDFKIVGFVDAKEITVFVNQKALAEEVTPDGFSRLKVKCESSQFMDKLRAQLTDSGFVVSALTDLIAQVDKAFNVIKLILGFFGAIALMVSAIGMFNTMTVTLLERTEEIGVMKSIGASDYDILWMFVFESTIMGFLGGIAGIILGFIGGNIFNLVVNFLAQKLGGEAVALFYFPGWFLFFILVVATLVGFFTGLIPARKASITDPLEALRYK
jgi:putative ABC transport system permease protein